MVRHVTRREQMGVTAVAVRVWREQMVASRVAAVAVK